MVTMGIFPYQGKIPMVEPESNPGPHDREDGKINHFLLEYPIYFSLLFLRFHTTIAKSDV
jgi:hypothetical protein